MLAQTLQALEGDGLVKRVAHDVVPPHVDYSLTPLGQDAARHVAALTGWIGFGDKYWATAVLSAPQAPLNARATASTGPPACWTGR